MGSPQLEKDKLEKKFKDIPEEWRQNMCYKASEEHRDIKGLYDELLKIAMMTVANDMAEKVDPAIEDLKDKLDKARADYREARAMFKLQFPYLVGLLEKIGEKVPSYESFLNAAAKKFLEERGM